MNKDLLFMLDNGEEFIKGVYEASEERIYYISVDELNTFEDIEMLKENVVHIYEENRIEFELLIKNIKLVYL